MLFLIKCSHVDAAFGMQMQTKARRKIKLEFFHKIRSLLLLVVNICKVTLPMKFLKTVFIISVSFS